MTALNLAARNWRRAVGLNENFSVAQYQWLSVLLVLA